MLMPHDHVDELVRAKRHREEPSRFVQVDQKTVIWTHTDTIHLLVYVDGTWQCDCSYGLQSYLPCSHVRAWEQIASDGSLSTKCTTQANPLPDSTSRFSARATIGV